MKIDFEALRQSALQRRERERAELEAAGIVKIGSRYFKGAKPAETIFSEESAKNDAKIDANRKTPISVTDAANLGLTVGTTPEDIEGKVVRKVVEPTAGILETIAAGDSTVKITKQINDLISEKNADTGGTATLRNLMKALGFKQAGFLKERKVDEELRTLSGLLRAEYRKYISGTAASEGERKELQGLLPSPSKTRQENLTDAETFIKKINTSNAELKKRFSLDEYTPANQVGKPNQPVADQLRQKYNY